MQEIPAFPHLSLSDSKSLITSKGWFPVSLEVPVFLCLPVDPHCLQALQDFLPPGPCPHSLLIPSYLPAVTTGSHCCVILSIVTPATMQSEERGQYIWETRQSVLQQQGIGCCQVRMVDIGMASLIAQLVKNPPAMQDTWVQSLGWEDPLEKGKTTHSSILAWRIPWTVQSMGWQRIRHN